MALEQTLHELSTELTALEDQDIALRQQVMQEIQKLDALEREV